MTIEAITRREERLDLCTQRARSDGNSRSLHASK